MFWNRYCPQCEQKNAFSALYCSNCATRLTAIRCGCGSEIPGGGNHCARCGRDADGHKAADMGQAAGTRAEAGRYWARDVDEIATRIETSDLVQEYFAKGVEIELGTEALLLQDGAYVGTLRPGRHEVKSARDLVRFQAQKHTTVILYDAFDVHVAWKAGPFPSKDPQDVTANLEVIMRIENPAAFFTNVMKGRSRFTRGEVEDLFKAPVLDLLRDAIRATKYQDLRDDAQRKSEIERTLIQKVQDTLKTYGLGLSTFRLMQFECPFYDEKLNARRREISQDNAFYDVELEQRFRVQVDRARDEVKLGDAVGRVGLEGAKLGQERDVLDVSQQADHLAKRLPFLRRLLEGDNLDKMSKLTSEEDWEKFKRNVDRDKLLRDHEWTLLRSELSSKEASEAARLKHAAALLEATHKADLEQFETLSAYRLRLAEAEASSKISDAERAERRKELVDQLDLKERARQSDLNNVRALFEQEIAEGKGKLDLAHSAREMQIDSLERIKRMKLMVKREEAAIETNSRIQIMEMENRRLQMIASAGLSQEQMLTLLSSGNADVLKTLAENRGRVEAEVAKARMDEMQKRLDDAKSDKKDWQEAGRKQLEETSNTARVVGSGRPVVMGPGGAVSGGGHTGVAPYFCEKHQIRHDGVLCPLCKVEGATGA